jgi:hypothetical protein
MVVSLAEFRSQIMQITEAPMWRLAKSFIYELFHRSNLPWVYGGEYQEFGKLAATVVQAWISVGLKVYLVFDGASYLC